jgi:hypothetical protein
MLDWLKDFDVERWWKAAIAAGLAIVIVGAMTKDHGIALVGLGIVACGFGEWMNHRTETKSRKGGTLTTFPRVNRAQGLALVGLGIILIAAGLYRLVAS